MAKCLFCPNPANSKEHLFPKWLNTEFPNPTNERRRVIREAGDDRQEWHTWETAYIQIRAVLQDVQLKLDERY